MWYLVFILWENNTKKPHFVCSDTLHLGTFPFSALESVCNKTTSLSLPQDLHFSFHHFLSLSLFFFCPISQGFLLLSLSSMHFCSHEFFFFVALFFAVFEAFFCVEQSRFHLPGFFELCPCLKSSALPVSFLFDRMFLPIHRSGCCICISVNFFDWLWLLFGGCLRYEIEVWVIYVYFVVWLAKNYYLGFE